MPLSIDWPAGYARRVLKTVDSTNAEAARNAATLSGPEWILALEQTAPRGRRGRAWRNPKGNFAATLALVCPGEPAARLALRSFVAALAVYDAVATVTGRVEGLALKWPNDVLLNGGKLAGILLETLGQDRLAIGIGVNLADAPTQAEVDPGALRPVSVLSETGARVTPKDFLGPLATAYAAHEDLFREQGFAPIRGLWLSRAARLGQPITARTGAREVVGTFADVDEAGHIVLKTGGGLQKIPAADIYF